MKYFLSSHTAYGCWTSKIPSNHHRTQSRGSPHRSAPLAGWLLGAGPELTGAAQRGAAPRQPEDPEPTTPASHHSDGTPRGTRDAGGGRWNAGFYIDRREQTGFVGLFLSFSLRMLHPSPRFTCSTDVTGPGWTARRESDDQTCKHRERTVCCTGTSVSDDQEDTCGPGQCVSSVSGWRTGLVGTTYARPLSR